MAESEEPNDSLLWSVIGFIFILMVIGTYIGGGIGNDAVSGNGAPTGTQSAKNETLFGRFLSSKPIIEGERVINATVARVRQTTGGAIIGEQEKRAVAEVIEGPVAAFGQNWYRLNYKKAPDGWVAEEDITANIGTFRMLNIVPIIFSVLRPIGFLLTLIFIIILVLIVIREKKTTQLITKRKAHEREMAPTNKFAQNIAAGSAVAVANDTEVFQASAPPKQHTVSEAEGAPETQSVKESAPTNLPTGDMSGLVFKKSGTKLDADGGPKNEKWERVQRLIGSYNASDWKQAIIEADIMLDEMLNKMGYKGNSIGEMLKQIEESDFVTLNKAWEAHKIRNRVAHQGGEFIFSKDEAERVISLYQKVFEEFYYV